MRSPGYELAGRANAPRFGQCDTWPAKISVCLVACAFLFLLYNLDIVRIWTVRHTSMQPLLRDGDTVLSVATWLKNPGKGDIVVAATASTGNIVKRVRNMVLMKDEEGKERMWYDLRGDNPNESMDSRQLGLFPDKSIRGTIVIIRFRDETRRTVHG